MKKERILEGVENLSAGPKCQDAKGAGAGAGEKDRTEGKNDGRDMTSTECRKDEV
jgi:hypothetical protein